MEHPGVLVPFACLFGMMALFYPVGRVGWIWLPRLVCAALIVVMAVLITRWQVMPSGLVRIVNLAAALFLVLPCLVGVLVGVWLGRRKRRGSSHPLRVPEPPDTSQP